MQYDKTRRGLIAFIAIAILAGIASAESEGPSPTGGIEERKPPKAVGKTHHHPSAKRDRGTDAAPLVVKLINTPNADSNTGKTNEKAGEKAAKDWWITAEGLTAFFTGGLLLVGAFQAGLFFWQLRLLGKSLGDTKDAAKAAQQSADALINAERPHMLIEGVIIKGFRWPEKEWGELVEQVGIEQAANQLKMPMVNYGIKNHGKSPAWVINAVARFEGLDEPRLPKSPIYWEPGVFPAPYAVPPGQVIGEIKPYADLVLAPGEWQRIIDGDRHLFFHGFVEYTDIFYKDAKPRISRFAWKFLVGGGINEDRFVPCGPAAYWEYT